MWKKEKMLIRKFTKEDIHSINKLGVLLHGNYKFSLDNFSYCLVINNDDCFIGFLIYSEIYERAEIVDIIIEPDHRKKGYATLLINHFFNILNVNITNITLEVNSLNHAAINLYKKHGFEIVATRKKYYNGTDAYLMKKELR